MLASGQITINNIVDSISCIISSTNNSALIEDGATLVCRLFQNGEEIDSTSNYKYYYVWKKNGANWRTFSNQTIEVVNKYLHLNKSDLENSNNDIFSCFVYDSATLSATIHRTEAYTGTFHTNFVNESDDKTYEVYGGSVYAGIPGQVTRTPLVIPNYQTAFPSTDLHSGYIFKCWNTASNGTGIDYNPGDEVYSNITLYAIWIPIISSYGDLICYGELNIDTTVKKWMKFDDTTGLWIRKTDGEYTTLTDESGYHIYKIPDNISDENLYNKNSLTWIASFARDSLIVPRIRMGNVIAQRDSDDRGWRWTSYIDGDEI